MHDISKLHKELVEKLEKEFVEAFIGKVIEYFEANNFIIRYVGKTNYNLDVDKYFFNIKQEGWVCEIPILAESHCVCIAEISRDHMLYNDIKKEDFMSRNVDKFCEKLFKSNVPLKCNPKLRNANRKTGVFESVIKFNDFVK